MEERKIEETPAQTDNQGPTDITESAQEI